MACLPACRAAGQYAFVFSLYVDSVDLADCPEDGTISCYSQLPRETDPDIFSFFPFTIETLGEAPWADDSWLCLFSMRGWGAGAAMVQAEGSEFGGRSHPLVNPRAASVPLPLWVFRASTLPHYGDGG